jgi:hypothetical protein
MPELSRLCEPVNARVEPGELDRRYIVVDVDFAARLQTRHTRRFECAIHETPGGREEFTRDVPNVGEEGLAQLDDAGLIKLGSEVERGSILVGKVTPRLGAALSPEEKLLRAIFGEKAGDVVDSSLRCPPWCAGVVVDARMSGSDALVEVAWERPLAIGDVLLVGDEPVVVADIRRLAADLAWTGGLSQVAVAKAATAVDVLHARSIGPYSSATQQPLREREQWGGQLLERAQLERLAAAAPWAAWELLTIKADAIDARTRAYESIVKGENPDVQPVPATPKAEPANTGDTFWFFERRAELQPGEVPTVAPEGVKQLQACLRVFGLELDVAMPEIEIRQLTPEQLRESSHGQVVEPGDLDSQKIFGPLRDYECACGKYRRMKHRGIVCEACGVEVASATVRRQRFGHVELALRCRHPLVPEWTIAVVPVLPPGLRVGTDLDDRYRALLEHNHPSAQPTQLQAAVDQLAEALVEYGDQHFAALFSKPVDYSGIASLVADPSLEPGACRVPRAMLCELFKPHAYSLLEARGYVATIKSAKRMLDQRRPEALWAIEAASEGFPVLLMVGSKIVSRRVQGWDAPAIAVDPATARLLASFTVTVHVPLMQEAALQCAELDDDPEPRSTASELGWMGHAREHGRFVASAVAAAQRGERSACLDSIVALALGRTPAALDPSTRERWATRERERRDQVWARREPAASPQHEPTSHPYFERRLDELELTTAVARALYEAGITTVGELCQNTESSLLKLRGISRKGLKEVKQILASLGLSLGMRVG